jgi:hypothetical protein
MQVMDRGPTICQCNDLPDLSRSPALQGAHVSRRTRGWRGYFDAYKILSSAAQGGVSLKIGIMALDA